MALLFVVGVGALDGPLQMVRIAENFVKWTVEDAGPYNFCAVCLEHAVPFAITVWVGEVSPSPTKKPPNSIWSQAAFVFFINYAFLSSFSVSVFNAVAQVPSTFLKAEVGFGGMILTVQVILLRSLDHARAKSV